MRKLSIHVFVTALAVSAVVPVTAYAATSTYNIPRGKMFVISGNINGTNCGQNLPEIKIPCFNNSNNSLPGLNFQIPNQSGNTTWCKPGNITWCKPGNTTPDKPGTETPDKPGTETPDKPGTETPDKPGTETPDKPGTETPDKPGTETPDKPEEDGSQDAFTQQIVKLVNEERAKAGLSPLTIHAGATKAAQTRAKEIEISFAHTRPNGSSFSTALTAAGVNYKRSGENIAYGQKTPAQVMQGWMNSSGHRANILNANFTSIGVGHYKNASGVDYWVQLFIQ